MCNVVALPDRAFSNFKSPANARVGREAQMDAMLLSPGEASFLADLGSSGRID